MKRLLTLFLIIFLGLLSYAIYGGHIDLSKESQIFSVISKQELSDVVGISSNLSQFVPNMRFSTNILKYYIQPDCSIERKQSSRKAFNILSEKTGLLEFKEITSFNKDVQILIKCSEESPEINSNNETYKTFIAGEGGPTKFLELEPYALIIQGEVQLYSNKDIEKCDKPLVEIHEILHVFGFDHINDKESILFPSLSCEQDIKENIITALKELYSEPAKSEITISNVSASKIGRYLDFSIDVKNTGILESSNVELEIYSDGSEIKKVQLNNISPGMIRSLEMKNVQLNSKNAKSIKFVVKSLTEEYSLENNIVEMSLE